MRRNTSAVTGQLGLFDGFSAEAMWAATNQAMWAATNQDATVPSVSYPHPTAPDRAPESVPIPARRARRQRTRAKRTGVLPLRRLVRSGEAETSLLAAIKAAKASRRAVEAVSSVMADGTGRMDEEIWMACRSSGYICSLSTIQHGRLALSESGVLVPTGETRVTTDRMPSRVWILPMGGHQIDACSQPGLFDGPVPRKAEPVLPSRDPTTPAACSIESPAVGGIPGSVPIPARRVRRQASRQEGTEALPFRRLVRSGEAETSLLAAIKASKASRRAVQAVSGAMVDGTGRIDEEIWMACRSGGYICSLSTIRHGRLALSESRVLVPTGETRVTRDGMPSRVWVFSRTEESTQGK